MANPRFRKALSHPGLLSATRQCFKQVPDISPSTQNFVSICHTEWQLLGSASILQTGFQQDVCFCINSNPSLISYDIIKNITAF